MNFFIADVQTCFGTFVAFYLARLGWSQESVGIALGVGGMAAVLAQIPGGALADAVSSKRALIAIGILMICAAALILVFVPTPALVFLAELLHGSTAGLITPAISAISLGVVGRHAMSVRTGRNYRFSGAGHVLTAAAMGAAGAFLSDRAIFVVAAAGRPSRYGLVDSQSLEDRLKESPHRSTPNSIHLDCKFILAESGAVSLRELRYWRRAQRRLVQLRTSRIHRTGPGTQHRFLRDGKVIRCVRSGPTMPPAEVPRTVWQAAALPEFLIMAVVLAGLRVIV